VLGLTILSKTARISKYFFIAASDLRMERAAQPSWLPRVRRLMNVMRRSQPSSLASLFRAYPG